MCCFFYSIRKVSDFKKLLSPFKKKLFTLYTYKNNFALRETSQNPKNKRLRPSVLLQLPQGRFLIDAGPDFRYQALRTQCVSNVCASF